MASRTSAVSERVAPTETVAVDGATWTDSIELCGPNVSDVHANTTGTRIVAATRKRAGKRSVRPERKVEPTLRVFS